MRAPHDRPADERRLLECIVPVWQERVARADGFADEQHVLLLEEIWLAATGVKMCMCAHERLECSGLNSIQ